MWILVLHITLCGIYFVLHRRRRGEIESGFPAIIILLLPIFGFLMWLVDWKLVQRAMFGTKEVEVEKLKVTDSKYRRLETDEGTNDYAMVPLEDALVVNDEKLRRSLLLDILHKNPEEYLTALTRAKGSDDVEITHYATTTLLEIQSEYEQRLQNFLQEFSARKEDVLFLQEYRDCINRYVNSGLIDGSVLKMQQEKLVEILSVLINKENPGREDVFLYIKTTLDLKQYEAAIVWLEKSHKECVETEEWNQLAVRYYWETGQSEEIEGVLRNIKKSNMYLSKEGKEWFQFWSKGNDYGEKEIQ